MRGKLRQPNSTGLEILPWMQWMNFFSHISLHLHEQVNIDVAFSVTTGSVVYVPS